MKHIYYILFALICMSTLSCNKVLDVTEKPYPLVKKVIFEDGHYEIYNYDSSGRITHIDFDDGSWVKLKYNLDAENNGTLSGWWLADCTISNGLCTHSNYLGDFLYVGNKLSRWQGSPNWTQDYYWSNDCLTMICTKTVFDNSEEYYQDCLEYYDVDNPFADQAFDLNFALLSDIFSGQMPYIYGWFGKGSSKLLKSSGGYRFYEYTWENDLLIKVTITEGDEKYTVSLEYYN